MCWLKAKWAKQTQRTDGKKLKAVKYNLFKLDQFFWQYGTNKEMLQNFWKYFIFVFTPKKYYLRMLAAASDTIRFSTN